MLNEDVFAEIDAALTDEERASEVLRRGSRPARPWPDGVPFAKERCLCGERALDECDCCSCCHECRCVRALDLIGYTPGARSRGPEALAADRAHAVEYIAARLVGNPLDVVPSAREYRAHSIDAAYRRMHARQAAAVAIARAQRRAA